MSFFKSKIFQLKHLRGEQYILYRCQLVPTSCTSLGNFEPCICNTILGKLLVQLFLDICLQHTLHTLQRK